VTDDISDRYMVDMDVYNLEYQHQYKPTLDKCDMCFKQPSSLMAWHSVQVVSGDAATSSGEPYWEIPTRGGTKCSGVRDLRATQGDLNGKDTFFENQKHCA